MMRLRLRLRAVQCLLRPRPAFTSAVLSALMHWAPAAAHGAWGLAGHQHWRQCPLRHARPNCRCLLKRDNTRLTRAAQCHPAHSHLAVPLPCGSGCIKGQRPRALHRPFRAAALEFFRTQMDATAWHTRPAPPAAARDSCTMGICLR